MNLNVKLLTSFILVGLLPFTTIGIIALSISGDELETRANEHLKSITEISKNYVEHYFETSLNQIETFSSNKMTIEALDTFRTFFYTVTTQTGIYEGNIQPVKQRLQAYYDNQFAVEFEKQVGQKSSINPMSLNDTEIVMQDLYISNNPYELGSKDKMMKSEETLKTDYGYYHAEIQPIIQDYLDKFGYYDIFLIDEKGQIVYSVFKELDFGTNLRSGPFSQTNLADVFRSAMGAGLAQNGSEVFQSDYAVYGPSYNAPASFIASPVMKNDVCIGVVAFQMPINKLNEITKNIHGLGSGEVYIVGSDYLLRSDSIRSPELYSVNESYRNPEDRKIITPSTKQVLGLKSSDTSGVHLIQNYLGESVLSYYTTVKAGQMNYALIAEIVETEAYAGIYSLTLLSIIIGVIGVIIILLTAYLLSRNITRPIKKAINAIHAISKGDLSYEFSFSTKGEIGELIISIERLRNSLRKSVDVAEKISNGNLTVNKIKVLSDKDSFGKALNKMLTNLNNIVRNIISTSSQVAYGSQELSQAVTQIADGATAQANSVSQTYESMKEMKVSIEKNLKNVEETEKIAANVSEDAYNSVEAVLQAINSMKGIAEKITIIEEIARKTELLALNAAVEAARAGEQGKGFSVVASEIGKLAESSQESANEISQFSSNGMQIAEKASKMLQDLVPEILKTKEFIQGIAQSTEEQNISSSKINTAMQELDSIIHQNAAAAEQMAATSTSLHESANNMTKTVEFFTIQRRFSETSSHPGGSIDDPNNPNNTNIQIYEEDSDTDIDSEESLEK